MNRNPSGSGPNPCWYFGCPVAASAPRVRPWNEFFMQTISIRSGCPLTTWWWRASLIAASFASAPLLQKKTRPSVLAWRTSFSARGILGSGTLWLEWVQRREEVVSSGLRERALWISYLWVGAHGRCEHQWLELVG